MTIQEILRKKLQYIYAGNTGTLLQDIYNILEPELPEIVNTFYAELLDIPAIAPILENSIVQKNLRNALKTWITVLFQPHTESQTLSMIERQKHIGAVHANININLNYFTHGISILKRELYARIHQHLSSREDFTEAFLVIGQLFDVLVSIISEAYFSHEIVHETNEFSLRVKGVTHNTAIECERLRSLLLDWLRNALTFLYQTPDITPGQLPKLQYSNFGLWVIYKSDLLSHTLNVSEELKKQIQEIDEALFLAAKLRQSKNESEFFAAIGKLNDAVTRTSWFLSSLVEQVMELDTGMDPLTRLFNRRYLDTILRRQTDISMKQGLPYSILMLDLDHFKQVNDTHGHESGDVILKQFSELLLLSVRTSDFIFRYGGEEFLIVLGNVGPQEAQEIAEKIRKKCETHDFQLPGNKQIRKTCSIGVASYAGHPNYNRILKLADAALYDAKNNGRNRIVFREE